MSAPANVTEVRVLANHVGGEWVPSSATDTLRDCDPATGELLAHVPLSTGEDVDSAVRAARGAQARWRAVSPLVRARAVMALRDVLDAHREELAELVTQDMGKTLDDARAEVGRGIESCEAAIGMPHLLKGENLEGVATGLDVELVRQPVGVVAAITPFNFPAMIPCGSCRTRWRPAMPSSSSRPSRTRSPVRGSSSSPAKRACSPTVW
jgi:malonate-semialdehyde dehydrogenase (acetylating)/methylmalonate-semialdehyde dehydrogenase